MTATLGNPFERTAYKWLPSFQMTGAPEWETGSFAQGLPVCNATATSAGPTETLIELGGDAILVGPMSVTGTLILGNIS